MNRWLCMACLVVLVGCGEPELVPRTQFEIDNLMVGASSAKAAPEMQEQLYALAHYTTHRFSMKPEFVFLDMDRQTDGNMNEKVTHLNFVHLAYWKQEQLAWSGSVLLSPDRGWMGFSERGYMVKLAKKGENYELLFGDGKAQASHAFPIKASHQQWLPMEGGRLYLDYFVLPKAEGAAVLPRKERATPPKEEKPAATTP